MPALACVRRNARNCTQGLASTKTPHETKSLKTQIARADRQIDNLVYELYGLTPEEIKIVESAGSEPARSADAAETLAE